MYGGGRGQHSLVLHLYVQLTQYYLLVLFPKRIALTFLLEIKSLNMYGSVYGPFLISLIYLSILLPLLYCCIYCGFLMLF